MEIKMAKAKLSFEDALEKLEELVTEIEQGAVPLEESIKKYEDGLKLIKSCRAILNEAEKKIQILAKGEGDTLTPAGELADDQGE